MTIIDTPEGVEVFQFLQCYYALSIQAKTGLHHSRGSIIKLCQQRYGIKSRTAAGALAEMKAIKDRLDASL